MDELSVEKFLICNGHKSTGGRAPAEKSESIQPFGAEIVRALCREYSKYSIQRSHGFFLVVVRTKNVIFWQI